jgi:hypothetical protein
MQICKKSYVNYLTWKLSRPSSLPLNLNFGFKQVWWSHNKWKSCHINFARKRLCHLNFGFIQVWWSHNKWILCHINFANTLLGHFNFRFIHHHL